MSCVIAQVGDKSAPQVNLQVSSLIVNGTNISATPDSGAERTTCGLDVLKKLDIDNGDL